MCLLVYWIRYISDMTRMDTHSHTYLICMRSFNIKNRFSSLAKDLSSLPSAVSRLKLGPGLDMILALQRSRS